jgi:hypothetical protein
MLTLARAFGLHPLPSMKESRTAVVAALIANGGLAVIKGMVATMTGSAGMLAETFHSVADTGAQALLFLGMRTSRRRPDRRHPFGHGKDVYFWSFVVAVMLFTLGGAFSIWESVHKLREPGSHESVGWAYAVLATGFAFESGTFVIAWRSLTRARRGRSLAVFWRDTVGDACPGFAAMSRAEHRARGGYGSRSTPFASAASRPRPDRLGAFGTNGARTRRCRRRRDCEAPDGASIHLRGPTSRSPDTAREQQTVFPEIRDDLAERGELRVESQTRRSASCTARSGSFAHTRRARIGCTRSEADSRPFPRELGRFSRP